MAKIKLIGSLKRMVGYSEKEFQLTEPTPLKTLIELDVGEDHLVIIINEKKGGNLDTLIQDDDYVLISPVFGGG